jgi:hypothetical protein
MRHETPPQASEATAPELNTIQVVDANLRCGFTQLPRPIIRAKGLSPLAKLTYALLLDYAWQKGSCFPGQQRMADDLSVSRMTISRVLTELRDYGLIDWRRRGLTMTNVYYILPLAENPRLSFTD